MTGCAFSGRPASRFFKNSFRSLRLLMAFKSLRFCAAAPLSSALAVSRFNSVNASGSSRKTDCRICWLDRGSVWSPKSASAPSIKTPLFFSWASVSSSRADSSAVSSLLLMREISDGACALPSAPVSPFALPASVLAIERAKIKSMKLAPASPDANRPLPLRACVAAAPLVVLLPACVV